MFIYCAYLFRSRQLLYIIMCYFLCQQLFSTFFDFIFALSKKALKTRLYFVDLLLPCSATLVNIHPCSTKVNNIFQTFFQKGTLTNTHNFLFLFCAVCTPPLYFRNKKSCHMVTALSFRLFT